jgi:hypothetical protein
VNFVPLVPGDDLEADAVRFRPRGMARVWPIVATAVAVSIAGDAFFVEPYCIEVTHQALAGAVAAPLKIGLVSDIHTRGFGRRERDLLRLLDAERPDAILIAGDALGRKNGYGDVDTLLRRMHAPLGVWMVRGNWEDDAPLQNERMFYASAGVHLLLNQARPIRPDVWVLGLDDAAAGHPKPDPALESIPEGAYAIALVHSPAYFDRLAGRVPLALAGHTHGGQVNIPFVPVFWLSAGAGRFVEGWYAEGGSSLYVTRGIGTSVIRARLWCRPELSIITIAPPAPGAGSKDRVPAILIGLPQVTPFDVTLRAGGSQQFATTVPCTVLPKLSACPQGVTWKTSIGTVSDTGVLTAPDSPGVGTVTATSVADGRRTGTAAVTVMGAIPLAQTCHARAVNVDSVSCLLQSLAAGHTLVAVARAQGRRDARVESFSDSADGAWPAANAASASYTAAGLAGGAAFFSDTKASASPVRISVRVSNGGGGDELTVWDFARVYSLARRAPTPATGTDGATPRLARARAGDLLFAWSVDTQCFLEPSPGALFTDITPAGSCDVEGAAMMPAAPLAAVSDRFPTEGNGSVSGIMAFGPRD